MQLKVRDVCHGQTMASRALVLQQKTQRPVQFEITEPTRDAVLAWITYSQLKPEDFLFPSRIRSSPHRTYLRGSMPGSSIRGSDNWDWIPQVTVPTR